MGSNNELAQMAHLMRRAGFGATRGELDALVAKGYEAVVEDLVNPERMPDIDEDIIRADTSAARAIRYSRAFGCIGC